ncbi:hypothetical protein OF83DRAFT_1038132, partial [Amylostereum chailletii]
SANTFNPLAFNEWADRSYYSMYVLVFRKSRISRIPGTLYDKYVSRGYLDPTHTMGEEYHPKASMFCNKEYKQSAVYQVEGTKDAYTIIRAKCPEHWCDGARTIAKDLLHDGYQTTIGGAEFYEVKANKLN